MKNPSTQNKMTAKYYGTTHRHPFHFDEVAVSFKNSINIFVRMNMIDNKIILGLDLR